MCLRVVALRSPIYSIRWRGRAAFGWLLKFHWTCVQTGVAASKSSIKPFVWQPLSPSLSLPYLQPSMGLLIGWVHAQWTLQHEVECYLGPVGLLNLISSKLFVAFRLFRTIELHQNVYRITSLLMEIESTGKMPNTQHHPSNSTPS